MRFLLLLLCLGLAACSQPGPVESSGPVDPVDDPLPQLPRADLETDEDGRYVIRVQRLSEGLTERINILPSGSVTVLVINDVDEATVEQEGLDLTQGAVSLWLRGRGTQRHVLPQATIGPVNAGVMEDWNLDLPAGDYVLQVTAGGQGEAIVLAR